MDKILVVDDEPDTANLAKMILEDAGYQVTCASEGAEALKMIESSCPDLVLMDLVMPGMSGLQVCKILKDQSWTRPTPVIIFTVLDRPSDRTLTSNARANAHLVKPFTREALLSEVEVLLKNAKQSKFSDQLNITHDALIGRKILLEFDPRTDYDRIVRDYALECKSHNELVFVLSRKESAIQQGLEGEEGIRFTEFDSTMKFSPLLAENDEKPLSFVVDSLSDLALSRSENEAYRFAQNSLNALATPRVSAIYLVNPQAHNEKALASLRGLYSNQLTYKNHTLTSVRFAAKLKNPRPSI
jgi:CheY-like chemotaxis protein